MSEIVMGTRVKFLGDSSNASGAGKVVEFRSSEWGTQARVVLDAEPSRFGPEFGIPEREFWISLNALRDENRWKIEG
jgi:hypothetical protein